MISSQLSSVQDECSSQLNICKVIQDFKKFQLDYHTVYNSKVTVVKERPVCLHRADKVYRQTLNYVTSKYNLVVTLRHWWLLPNVLTKMVHSIHDMI